MPFRLSETEIRSAQGNALFCLLRLRPLHKNGIVGLGTGNGTQEDVRMLEVQGIKKSYGRARILKDISFTAEPGECVGIAGGNGCGKTTLLSVLAGALRADGGSIRFDGKEAVGHPKVFADSAAYVPQENPLIEELTVRDNFRLWYRGGHGSLEAAMKSDAAVMLGVDAMAKKQAGKLSGGMKKRLSIACALSNQASVLILDEPGAALDLKCRADIRAYLNHYLTGGGTVILTSHDMEELALCTKLFILRDGILNREDPGISEERLISCF